ncbi:MAG: cold-shock protein [Acidimicrobiia bacterium]|nr:cold-shock protein [Acidimicrobiia bacterium]
MQGVVRLYDPVTETGVVLREDDRTEVFLRSESLEGSVFRALRQGQRILFDLVDVNGKPHAANVRLSE